MKWKQNTFCESVSSRLSKSIYEKYKYVRKTRSRCRGCVYPRADCEAFWSSLVVCFRALLRSSPVSVRCLIATKGGDHVSVIFERKIENCEFFDSLRSFSLSVDKKVFDNVHFIHDVSHILHIHDFAYTQSHYINDRLDKVTMRIEKRRNESGLVWSDLAVIEFETFIFCDRYDGIYLSI